MRKTRLEIRNILDDYKRRELEIEDDIERLEILKDKAEQAGIAHISLESKSTGKSDPTAIKVTKIIKLEEQIRADIAKLDEEKEKIEAILAKLKSHTQRRIIKLRYFSLQSWDEICEMVYGKERDFGEDYMRYYRKTIGLHGHALLGLEKIFKTLD